MVYNAVRYLSHSIARGMDKSWGRQISVKEVIMENSIRFPKNEAKEFAVKNGLQTAVKYIEFLPELNGWDYRMTWVKDGKYINLFCGYGLFQKFKQEHWPKEGAPDNPFSTLFYLACALRYDEAVENNGKVPEDL
jgi:hypothetical protein